MKMVEDLDLPSSFIATIDTAIGQQLAAYKEKFQTVTPAAADNEESLRPFTYDIVLSYVV